MAENLTKYFLTKSDSLETAVDIMEGKSDISTLNLFVFVLYIIIFVVGIIGNSLVITVIAKDKSMRSVANFFLFSLSLADLMIILFCLPIAAYEVYHTDWPFGIFLCKLMPYLQYVSVNASVLTMLSISCERFLVIWRPLNARACCTKKRSVYTICLIWLFCSATGSPAFVLSNIDVKYFNETEIPEDGKNVENFDYTITSVTCINTTLGFEWYYLLQTVLFYLVPGMILFFVYAFIIKALAKTPVSLESPSGSPPRAGQGHPQASLIKTERRRRFSRSVESRRQVIILLGSVVAAYFVCLLPYNLVVTLIVLEPEILFNMEVENYSVILSAARVSFFINSCINPILYNVISSKFRSAFYRIFVVRNSSAARRRSSTPFLYADRKGLIKL